MNSRIMRSLAGIAGIMMLTGCVASTYRERVYDRAGSDPRVTRWSVDGKPAFVPRGHVAALAEPAGNATVSDHLVYYSTMDTLARQHALSDNPLITMYGSHWLHGLARAADVSLWGTGIGLAAWGGYELIDSIGGRENQKTTFNMYAAPGSSQNSNVGDGGGGQSASGGGNTENNLSVPE